ncbi:MAG TPA: hypothetical protein VIN72_01440 [Lutibacter sp.]
MKKIGIILLQIYITAILVVSCSKNDNVNISSDSVSNVSSTILRIDKEAFSKLNSNRTKNISDGDIFTINKGTRVGDILQLNVSYSGGCRQHFFEIIWDGLVYTDNPCFMNLIIIHKGNNDTCEALITETIIVNLKELVGDITYKDKCAYTIFSTFNSSETPDLEIMGIN